MATVKTSFKVSSSVDQVNQLLAEAIKGEFKVTKIQNGLHKKIKTNKGDCSISIDNLNDHGVEFHYNINKDDIVRSYEFNKIDDNITEINYSETFTSSSKARNLNHSIVAKLFSIRYKNSVKRQFKPLNLI